VSEVWRAKTSIKESVFTRSGSSRNSNHATFDVGKFDNNYILFPDSLWGILFPVFAGVGIILIIISPFVKGKFAQSVNIEKYKIVIHRFAP
jgi:hypothetical protein